MIYFQVFGETLKHIETQNIEENKIKKIEREIKTLKYKNQSLILENKENMLRKGNR